MNYRFEIDYRKGRYEVFQVDQAGNLIGFTVWTSAEWQAYLQVIDGPAEVTVNC